MDRYPLNPPSEVRAVQGWMALDLWMALGNDSNDFDAYITEHGWAETWAQLLSVTRATPGRIRTLAGWGGLPEG